MRMEFAAEVVNEARDPGHNTPAILTMDQEDDRFFSVCHREPIFAMRGVNSIVAGEGNGVNKLLKQCCGMQETK
jgi:hypothetical protein